MGKQWAVIFGKEHYPASVLWGKRALSIPALQPGGWRGWDGGRPGVREERHVTGHVKSVSSESVLFFPRTLGSCKTSLLPSKEDFLVLIEQIWMEFGSLKQKILLWKHIFKFFFSFYCPVIWSQSFCDPVTFRYDIHKCFSALFCFAFPSG